jgi:hypothetical protein
MVLFLIPKAVGLGIKTHGGMMKLILEVPDEVGRELIQLLRTAVLRIEADPSEPADTDKENRLALLAKTTVHLQLPDIPQLSSLARTFLNNAAYLENEEGIRIETIRDLCQKTPGQLKKYRHCGTKVSKLVEQALNSAGLSLGMTERDIQAYIEGKFVPPQN